MQKSNQKNIAVIGLKGLPAFGGAATVGENIISRLSEKYNFTVYAISSHTDMQTGYNNGYKQIVFKSCKNASLNTFIYYIKSMIHVLLKVRNKYDFIFLHHAESGFITPLLRIRYRVLLTVHGTYFNTYDPKFNKTINKFFKWSEKINMRFANIIVSVSKPNATACKTQFNRNILHIPNGVNISERLDSETGTSYYLFSASRIYDLKGLHILLEALQNIKSKKILYVVGDLNQKPKYRDYLLSLVGNLNVKFIPVIKNKNELFNIIKKSELFIFPSTTEAMSMMLLEVASLNIPIIASDIPGNTSIFDEDEILFFKSEDSNSLAKCIVFANNNKQIMREKAKNAYINVKNNYSWESIALEYSNVFKQMN